MPKNVIIGLNVGHDGGAAILVDGVIKCAISEERINRKKYSKGYLNSFFYCLKAAGLKINDIALVVFSSYGPHLPKNFQGELSQLGLPSKKFISVNHHLSHAYGAFCLSPFDDALVIVMDGEGNEGETESYFTGSISGLKKIGGNPSNRNPAKGLGRTYEAFTNYLGWTDQEAGKTMALAAFGDSSKIKVPLFKIKKESIYGVLNHKYEKGVIEFAKQNKIDFGPMHGRGKTQESFLAAAYVQSELESAILKITKRLVDKTGKRKICLAGGVALNCVANNALLVNKIVDEVFIMPASSDKGQAIGNALYGFHYLTRQLPRQQISNDYFGKSYADDEIFEVLNGRVGIEKATPKKDIIFEKQTSITKTAASLIAKGKIIGWFQGGSELGPRALGHRSILSSPADLKIKKRLDDKVKHREWFRPYAPSCLLSKSSEYFDISVPSPFMLLAPKVKGHKIKDISAVVHFDKSARLQTVDLKNDPLYYELIREFYQITKIPILLNTSFNDRGPIAETPSDALSIFLSTDLDYLIINDYLICKK